MLSQHQTAKLCFGEERGRYHKVCDAEPMFGEGGQKFHDSTDFTLASDNVRKIKNSRGSWPRTFNTWWST